MSATRIFSKFKELLDVTWSSVSDGYFLKRSGVNIVGVPGDQVGPIWRGEYNPVTTYQPNDAVSYQGSSYRCGITTTGVAPVPSTASYLIPPLATTGSRGSIAALPASNQTQYYARGDNTWQLFQDAQPVGSIIQVKVTTIGSSGSTVVIPSDNTTPQISEGTQIISMAITPTYANSMILLVFSAMVGSGQTAGASGVSVALFRAGQANTIGATQVRLEAPQGSTQAIIQAPDFPGSVAAQTYTVRMGPTINTYTAFTGSRGDVPIFNQMALTTLTIYEIKQ